ncbi:serine/threonine-protein phosphatase [Lujinxingia vulgaris]|uniref:Serine/threonine-protein phosphatase n=1 Tax=Lujinxingia vulgaris TaxID=2600176 RepID=A0A5C6WXF5_9DELT|nr:PP2C family serine/threonine-protein phosphatase [Lujinxingia vulgaris]TXD34118.1 serine/threonine-protein phosphatase [Lujinxingia vulgaris]
MSARPAPSIVTLPSEPDAPTASILRGSDEQPYLRWTGPAEWLDGVREAFAPPGHPCLPSAIDTPDETSLDLKLPSPNAQPFDAWAWRNLPDHTAVDALLNLTRAIQQLHHRGWTLRGLRTGDLLLDASRGTLLIAAAPRLAPMPRTPDNETVWRDIRVFAELTYENFLGHEYPGGHHLVTLLQDRNALRDVGLTHPALPQLLAGCVTPYGDLAYRHTDELIGGLTHLRTELTRPLQLEVASRSTQGNYLFRQNNQDSCGHILLDTVCDSQTHRIGFFCVADGIGGIQDGAAASTAAVRAACAAFMRAWEHAPPRDILHAPTELARAIARVTSQHLALYGEFSPDQNRGGTTFTGLVIAGDHAGLCHVGDSRAWLLRDQHLIPLSEDHTLANIFKKLDHAPSPAERDASHRTIARFLSTGTELDDARIDTFRNDLPDLLNQPDLHAHGLRLRDGDLLILTTDGAHGELSDKDLHSLALTHYDAPHALCDAIVNNALSRVGKDNSTAMAIRLSRRPPA